MRSYRYLLDTHVLLWWLDGDLRLPLAVRDVIADPNHEIFISVVSAWEVIIKQQKRADFKLLFPLSDYFKRTDLPLLNIEIEHLIVLAQLPDHHRDPFDRMLVAQAVAENLKLVTLDNQLTQYSIPIFPEKK